MLPEEVLQSLLQQYVHAIFSHSVEPPEVVMEEEEEQASRDEGRMTRAGKRLKLGDAAYHCPTCRACYKPENRGHPLHLHYTCTPCLGLVTAEPPSASYGRLRARLVPSCLRGSGACDRTPWLTCGWFECTRSPHANATRFCVCAGNRPAKCAAARTNLCSLHRLLV